MEVYISKRMKVKIIKIFLKYLAICVITFQSVQAGIFHIPFQKKANLIIVKARVNGNSENFIFDTGAKTLIINSKYVEAYERKTNNKYEVKGVGSKVLKVEDINVKNFEFGNINKNRFNAIVLEMTLIEEIVGKPVYGMIGYEIFAGYDIVIDYKQSFLTFIPPAEFMNYWNQNVINRKFSYLDFSMSDHLPIVNALAGDKKITLGIDTGAARTLIDQNIIDLIRYEIEGLREQTLVGIDNENLSITCGTIRRIKIGQKNYDNIEILIKDLSHINDNISRKVNGLIGYDILKNYITIISYSNSKFIFVE